LAGVASLLVLAMLFHSEIPPLLYHQVDSLDSDYSQQERHKADPPMAAHNNNNNRDDPTITTTIMIAEVHLPPNRESPIIHPDLRHRREKIWNSTRK
jgi:hypothetical protein